MFSIRSLVFRQKRRLVDERLHCSASTRPQGERIAGGFPEWAVWLNEAYSRPFPSMR